MASVDLSAFHDHVANLLAEEIREQLNDRRPRLFDLLFDDRPDCSCHPRHVFKVSDFRITDAKDLQ